VTELRVMIMARRPGRATGAGIGGLLCALPAASLFTFSVEQGSPWGGDSKVGRAISVDRHANLTHTTAKLPPGGVEWKN
jgi:hypothetical protein